ncbi:hypothetical protein BRCON_2388 [Candidatus Sumerlaea chitinivorans]|uniref:Uncharacterized protein n=1 Tax=Sumerlaea chitinivorans TaxID=2250252 RepID=A0A2Z4Y8L1_SUMC1|nr:hypothetical protein BRCON_2388 [Candidatus Sumerlaea chitinivorans]
MFARMDDSTTLSTIVASPALLLFPQISSLCFQRLSQIRENETR